MNTIGEQLKRAREERGQSLDDIVKATRISRKHIEQLEAGIIPDLPQIYLRAFIKSYAHEVGMDSAPLLSRIDSLNATQISKHTLSSSTVPHVSRQPHQLNILFSLSIMLGIGLFALIYWKQGIHVSQPIQEVSFAEVVKEKERQQSPSPVPVVPYDISDSEHADSLVLEGVASESVWVRIVADGVRAKENNLSPRNSIRFKAKNYFSLSLGNPLAISFSLNGQKIGELSGSRKPLWNITLSRNSIRKPQADLGKSEQKNQH